MAYLEFPGSICFHLCAPINMISNSEVPGYHTFIVEGAQYKHAVITRSEKIFQITDLYSNDTFIKAMDGTEFELLPTMQPNQLVWKDQIRFGDTVAKFQIMHHDDVIESSQCSERINTPNTSSAGKMLAPETEDMRPHNDSEMITDSEMTDVFIPETQFESEIPATEEVDLPKPEEEATERQEQAIVSPLPLQEYESLPPEDPVEENQGDTAIGTEGIAELDEASTQLSPLQTGMDSQDGPPMPNTDELPVLQPAPEPSSPKENGTNPEEITKNDPVEAEQMSADQMLAASEKGVEEAQDESMSWVAEGAHDESESGVAEVAQDETESGPAEGAHDETESGVAEGAQAGSMSWVAEVAQEDSESCVAEVAQDESMSWVAEGAHDDNESGVAEGAHDETESGVAEVAQDESVSGDYESAQDESETIDKEMGQVLTFNADLGSVDDASSRESTASSEFYVRNRKTDVEQAGRLMQFIHESDREEPADPGDSEDEHTDQENLTPIDQTTQAVVSPSFRTRRQLKRQADIKPKTVSLTQFEDSERTSPKPKKMKSSFAMETQPISALELDEQSQLPSSSTKGPRRTNTILDSSSDDDDCADANTSLTVRHILKDILPFQSPSKKPSKSKCSSSNVKQEQPSQSPGSPKTPTPADNSFSIDESSPDLLPKLPSDSQIGDVLDLVNATQLANESAVMFDTSIDDNSSEMELQTVKPEVKEPAKKKVKFMKHGSDDDTPKAKESTGRPPKRVNAKKRIFSSFAMSSNIDSATKRKVETACLILGGALTDEMKHAEFYLTDIKIKMTAKYLAAICKGIPIVGEDFIDVSLKARAWQDPWKYVITNKEVEKQKGATLRQVLSESTKKKVLQGVTGIVTKHFRYTLADMKEIIESGGGEYISHSKTPRKGNKVIIFYNPDDTSELESLKKKHPKANLIKASELFKVVLSQIPLK